MKINKDLVDATMMLSFIILVLIGTSDFSNMLLKEITMGSLAVLSVAMIALRFIICGRKPIVRRMKNTNIKE